MQPAPMPPPATSERELARVQAREWVKKLPASLVSQFSHIIEADVTTRRHVHHGTPVGGSVNRIRAMKLIHRITNLYPYPSAVHLLNEAESRLAKIDACDCWSAERLLKDLLERPDAILS